MTIGDFGGQVIGEAESIPARMFGHEERKDCTLTSVNYQLSTLRPGSHPVGRLEEEVSAPYGDCFRDVGPLFPNQVWIDGDRKTHNKRKTCTTSRNVVIPMKVYFNKTIRRVSDFPFHAIR